MSQNLVQIGADGVFGGSTQKAVKRKCLTALKLANEADATRTRNLRIDSPMLYPIELRPQIFLSLVILTSSHTYCQTFFKHKMGCTTKSPFIASALTAQAPANTHAFFRNSLLLSICLSISSEPSAHNLSLNFHVRLIGFENQTVTRTCRHFHYSLGVRRK